MLVINLMGGVFLTLVDYVLSTLQDRKMMSPTFFQVILSIFRLFPLFSLTKAINKLYVLGSNDGACSYFSDNFLKNNCVSKQVPFVGCCKRKFVRSKPKCKNVDQTFPKNAFRFVQPKLSGLFESLVHVRQGNFD